MARARVDNTELQRLLSSPSGPVVRFLTEQATEVQRKTVAVVDEKMNHHPAGAPTIVKRFIRDGFGTGVEVGSARTGPRVITPVTAKALRFKPRGAAAFVFAQKVNSPGLGPLFGKYLVKFLEETGMRVVRRGG